ncbi:MAG: hypothetical protein M0R22_07160 [Dehalococcoidia bacterium]|nr:hypothetical protein [Dehalococcoidia bacterium]
MGGGLTMDNGKSSVTGLETHVASTLAYLGTWVSGIVLLLVETKDRVVRFHAMQSILVFGPLHLLMFFLNASGSLFSLGLWNGSLLPVSLVFAVLHGVVLVLSIVLWVLLMVKTYQRQQVLVPVAGDLAFWLLAKLGMPTPERDALAFQGLGGGVPRESHRGRLQYEVGRTGRIAGSIAAIVWSIFVFVMFNFYPDYIAFYQGVSAGGVSQLLRYPILTSELSRALPILNATLVVTVVGHFVALAWDKFFVREGIEVVIHAMGLVTILVFLRVFPFDYSALPLGVAVDVLPGATLAVLVVAAVATGVEIIVRLVRLITYALSR